MKKRLLAIALTAILGVTAITGCGNSNKDKAAADSKEIVMVWYPNESGDNRKAAREAIGGIVEKATGKKVVHKLTTDYAISIETLVNNKAALGYFGPQGYVEAHNKNSAILPIVVSSGASGTLKDAVYYSWLAVNKGQEDQYKKGDSYAIDNIQGKRMSFVSNSSTSGFKVPTAGIVGYFSKMDKWKTLQAKELIEGGKDKFFSEVMFGNSHQGSAMNLLSGKVDVAAFCDEVINPYVKLVGGKENQIGAVYAVKEGAAEPFNNMIGKEYFVISSTPVLNSPFVMNTKVLSKEDQEKIIAAFTSAESSNNPAIFAPKDAKEAGIYKKTKDEKFLKVEDSWFEPIRALSK